MTFKDLCNEGTLMSKDELQVIYNALVVYGNEPILGFKTWTFWFNDWMAKGGGNKATYEDAVMLINAMGFTGTIK